MKTIQETKQELWMKEQRVSYWEQNRVVPTMEELMLMHETSMEV